jgi:hypothetical protein
MRLRLRVLECQAVGVVGLGYRLVSGGIAVALAVTFALPGAAQAVGKSSGAQETAFNTASAGVKSISAASNSAASAGSSTASTSAAANPEANAFHVVEGRQSAVPEFSAAVTGTPRPTPSGPALYVDSVSGSGCSDTATGAGTEAAPFCTLQAAANAVAPGDTVLVTPGIYTGFTLTDAQGTASAPITFESSILPESPMQADSLIRITDDLNEGSPATPAHAIDVEDSSYVDLENFYVEEPVTSDALLIDASNNVTVDEFMDWVAYTPVAQTAPDIHVTGDSSYVTITRVSEFNANGQPYVQVDAGGSHDVIADSAFWGNYGTMVSVAGTPDAEITGNTFLMSYSTAISLTGTSPESTVEDNIVSFNGFYGTNTSSIVVGAGSTSGTTLDYNVVEPTSAPAYQWGSSTYSSATALHSATGEGAHEIYATPDVYVGGDVLMLGYNSVGIDAANAAAPGEQATDIYGQSCVDDPSYPVTGAGVPAYCSRGSFQYQDALSALLSATETGSMSVSADATQSHGLNTITSYSFNFGDGSAALVNSTGRATHTYAHSGAYSVSVTITDSTGAANTSAAAGVRTLGADFTAMAPDRVLDTRKGTGSGTVAPVPAGGSVTFPVPAAAASHGDWLTAVALNVTVTDATGGGYVSVQRGTSDFNYQAGQNLAAAVIAQVWNDNGTLSVTLFDFGAGQVDLIADMTGYFAIDATDGYTPIAPARLLDTRGDLGGSPGKIVPGRPDVLGVEGAGGGAIAAAGVTAVAVNLTVTDATGGGYVTAYPDGESAPGTSNLNFSAGKTLANFAIVPIGADGEIDLASSAPTDLIVDVVGYFDSTGGSGFVDSDPYRDIDTRDGNAGGYCTSAKGALARYGVLSADILCPTAAFPSPADLGEVTAVAVNQTVTQGTSTGYLTSYPAGTARPISSELNWQQVNQTVANFTFARLGSGNEVSFANESPGTLQLIVDVYGYFSAS